MKSSSKGSKLVDDYIALQPEEIQKNLMDIRLIIKKTAPEAEEMISYQMPGYRQNGMLVWFAAAKSHIGFYTTPEVLNEFRDKLKDYKTTKSAIHFPPNKPVPLNLIAEIVKCAVDVKLTKKLLKKDNNQNKP